MKKTIEEVIRTHFILKEDIENQQINDPSLGFYDRYLEIKINPGEKVGLVGYSGGGKSTFIKLILRLIDIQSGNILIDNQGITEVTNYKSEIQTHGYNQIVIMYSRKEFSDLT